MTQQPRTNLIQLLEVLETDYLEKDQFIKYLGGFDAEDIQALQTLLRIVYKAKTVIEGGALDSSMDWGPGRPTGIGIPGTSGPGGPIKPGGRGK
jgi:hypothetical protein